MDSAFYIAHYKGNVERRSYLESAFSNFTRQPRLITDFDAGEFEVAAHYVFDEVLFRTMMEPIKDIMVGYSVGLSQWKSSPWANCVAVVKEKQLSLNELEETSPWLRPRELTTGEVSLFLKHRLAWQKIVEGMDEWAIVGEDDIVLYDHSLNYLMKIAEMLPADFEYIDLVGASGLVPRVGNRVVNKWFYDMEPGRDRTTCCALLRKTFVQRLLQIDCPICVPVDWYLTYAFNRLGTKVYWLHPPLFGHGSEMRIYESSIQDRPA